MEKGIAYLGVKMDLGKISRGADNAPQAIRESKLFDELKSFSVNVIDFGDISTKVSDQLNTKNCCSVDLNDTASDFEEISDNVSKLISENYFPLVVGGDHSISIGTIAGIAKHYENLGVIWYDAHGDVNTPETSITGSIYGMTLAINLGFGDPSLVKVGNYFPKVKAENVVLIGTRELDDGEKEFLDNNHIKVYSMEDIRKFGIEQIIKESIMHLRLNCDGIHLSFDLDAIDPKDAPGVRTPVEMGLSCKESIIAMEILADSRVITSAEFTELNTNLDINNKTVETASMIIKALMLGNRLKDY